jgi:hypothetical protein
MRRPALAISAAVLALATPLAARAGDAEDEAAATQLFDAGRDMMKSGDYARACPKLAESARLKPTVGALAKLAECEEHERRLVSAYARWKQSLNLARTTGDERVGDVERELARIDALVPKLLVAASGALPSDAAIRVDAIEMSVAGLGVPLAVEPGHHVVQVTAPRKRAWSTAVDTVANGATTPVTIPALEDAGASIAVSPLAPTPASLAEPPALSSDARRGSSTWRALGLVAAGAGLGAVIAGGALGIDAIRKRDSAGCPGSVCPDEASAAELNGAKSSANWSTALLASGGALVAGGLFVWWVARDHASGSAGLLVTPAGLAGAF